jgi:hypothetical protein
VNSHDFHTSKQAAAADVVAYRRMCAYVVRGACARTAGDRDGPSRTGKGGCLYGVRTCRRCHQADALRYEKLTGDGPHASPTPRMTTMIGTVTIPTPYVSR